MEEVEGQESVVESGAQADSPSESAAESHNQEAPAQAAAPKQEETPFHEHPRFKELVEQKNAAMQSTRALELKLAQLEGRLQSQPSPQAQAAKDELIEDLKKIDPRLASRLEAFTNSSKTIEQLQQKLDQFEKAQQQTSQQATVKEAVSRINTWHEANKVPNEIKQAINNQLDVLYMTGKLNPQNLEQEYKKAYEPYKAFMETVKREALKSYVPEAKAASKVPPSQPKGTPARASKPAEKSQFKNREELAAAVAKEFIQNRAAKRDASPV